MESVVTDITPVSREEFDSLKEQMIETNQLMKEQLKMMQEMRINATGIPPEGFLRMPPPKPTIDGNNASSSNNPPQHPVFRFGETHTDIPTPQKKIVQVLDTAENKMLSQKMQNLEETFKSIQGLGSFGGVGYSDLCVFPNAQYPEKFKVPEFEKYNGTNDPYTHLEIYIGELGAHAENEGLRIQLFQKSLTGNARTWYTRLDSSKIKTWEDLAHVFLTQYGYLTKMVPDRYQLLKLSKLPSESSM